MKTNTNQTAKCGRLLCEFRLLQHGLITEPGDGSSFVARSKDGENRFTFQIKTCGIAKPAGGTGRLALDWWIPGDCVTDHVALVDVTGVQIWFFTFQEITELAQQEKDGMMHFYMYIDPTAKIRPDSKPHHDYEFRRYLVENVIPRFGISKKPNRVGGRF